MSTSNVTASPAPFKTLDGKEFLISPLDDRDLGEVDIWLRSNHLAKILKAIPQGLPKQQEESLHRMAVREAAEMCWMTREGMTALATVEGMTRLMWIGARKNHPELTHEAMQASIMHDGNKDSVAQNINEANTALAHAMPRRFKSDQTKPPQGGPKMKHRGGKPRGRSLKRRHRGKKTS